MIEFLLRRFVKNYENVNKPSVRTAVGNLASQTGVFCNLLLVIGKITVGLLASSGAIIADGFNNFMDAAGAVITLVGFRFAAKKADKKHPFGHGRFEYFAGLIVAILVLLVGFELAKSGIMEIIRPTAINFSRIIFLVLLASILLKIWMAWFYYQLSLRIGSSALKALSVDSRNDALITTAVLLTTILAHYTGINLDGWASLGVALLILYSGVELIKETADPLLGLAPSPELVEYITSKIVSYEHVQGIHDLLVHDYGPNRRYVSVHVEMPSELDSVTAHEIIDRIERDFLKNDHIHMIIHNDPVEVGEDYEY